MNRTDGVRRRHELHQKIDAERHGRIEFVANLRRTVAGMRKRLMDENRAVRAAWFGPTRAEQATVARIKAAEAARVAEAADAARIKAAEAARVAEAANAARIKAAEAARVAEAADAARIKAATAHAKEAVASITEALKDALIEEKEKTVLLKATKKPEEKKRGH